MSNSKRSLFAASFLTAMAMAWSPAYASIYALDLSCVTCGTASPNFGTVTATNDGSNLKIDVELSPNIFFNANGNGQHHALAFDLVGDPTISLVSPLPTGFSLLSTSAGSISQPPLTSGAGNNNFEYAIVYNPAQGAALVGSLVFELSGLSTASLESQLFHCTQPNGCASSGTYNLFFSSDINNGGLTGNVGAELSSAVPEPSTWAMMILGFLGVGFMAYRRRSQLSPMAD
jgi:hypothetical protein